tara:strand:+ start:602 stop:826 length:225 start_codon:yes stop_codon:yes gene_type:complete
MTKKPRIYVSGTIELNDNIHSKVKFSCDTEQGFWNQWGNTDKKLFKTVDIVSKIQEVISDVEIIDNIKVEESNE